MHSQRDHSSLISIQCSKGKESLQHSRSYKCVKEVHFFTSSFVPIISIGIDGISVDIPIIVIQTLEYSIPDDFHYSDFSLFGHLSIDSIRSLQGPCTTEKLLSIIPNREVFKQALSVLKLFAKVRMN